MSKELSKIFCLLARGFSYPAEDNTSVPFFKAVKEVAESLGIPCNLDSCYTKSDLHEPYTLLFINEPHGRWAPPFASVYLGGEGLLMAVGRDHARSFYQQAGLEPASSSEPEDFLPTELFFVAELIEKDELEILARFLKDHLLKWFPSFYNRLNDLGPHPYYLLLAEITWKLLNMIKQEVIDETT